MKKLKYPLAKHSEKPVTTYPLNKDELRVLALFWAHKKLETLLFQWLYETFESTDEQIYDYADDRLTKIAAILDWGEVDQLDAEVAEGTRKRVGEEGWTAFKETCAGKRCDDPYKLKQLKQKTLLKLHRLQRHADVLTEAVGRNRKQRALNRNVA